jgi:hypothetical protein
MVGEVYLLFTRTRKGRAEHANRAANPMEVSRSHSEIRSTFRCKNSPLHDAN